MVMANMKRLMVFGAVAAAVVLGMPSSASAAAVSSASVAAGPWGGAEAGCNGTNNSGKPLGTHSVNVRSSTSTGSTKVDTIGSCGTRKCYYETCDKITGGSYTCWSGGPSGNTWVTLNIGGTKRYVAHECVFLGGLF